jgi:hypothetical protein
MVLYLRTALLVKMENIWVLMVDVMLVMIPVSLVMVQAAMNVVAVIMELSYKMENVLFPHLLQFLVTLPA